MIHVTASTPTYTRSYILLLAVLVLVLLLPAPMVLAQTASERANIKVFLWPDKTALNRGELTRIEIQVRNDGRGTASDIRVVLPRNDRQFVYTNTTFDDVTDQEAILLFDPIEANRETLQDVFLRVQNNPLSGQFFLYATYSWNDDRGGRTDQRTERLALTVNGFDDTSTGGSNTEPCRDTQPPVIDNISLAPFGRDGYEVTWTAHDEPADCASGIDFYDVDFKRIPSNDAWRPLRRNIKEPTRRAVLAPTEGNHFTFRVRATDWAGLTSDWFESPIDTRNLR
ncbi:MAG: hypothetical protein HC837_21355 [Chloroflexaceae bacterium]|nr:hypothetical protein [Chloroflexaceae bacterium]